MIRVRPGEVAMSRPVPYVRRGLALAALLAAAALAPSPRAGAQDADTPLDRSLQKVEALLTSLKASGGADPALVRQLEAIAKDLREAKAAAGAATPPPAGGGPGAGAGAGAGAAAGASRWLIDRVMEGVELNEKDRKVAEDLLTVFGEDYALARLHKDDRSKQVLKSDVEDRIDRALPRREAGKIKNNLATQLRWMEWGGRR